MIFNIEAIDRTLELLFLSMYVEFSKNLNYLIITKRLLIITKIILQAREQ